jgi:lipoprotein-releasing system ATP-binding protein
MAESLVKVRHVAKTYAEDGNRVEVLRDVTFDVAAGEMVGLLGVSGAGKTTLLQILGGLDAASRGMVEMGGRDIGKLSPRELASFRNGFIGFVFQFHHLLPDFTALENTFLPGLMARKSRRECDKRARELLDAVGLSHRLQHFPSELSGGERQRVALARALFNAPSLVLADEPTGNLDGANGVHLLELFRRMNAEHSQTFLVATHNERLARGLQRTIVLDNGCVADGGLGSGGGNAGARGT